MLGLYVLRLQHNDFDLWFCSSALGDCARDLLGASGDGVKDDEKLFHLFCIQVSLFKVTAQLETTSRV
jgi:hypothetical protein